MTYKSSLRQPRQLYQAGRNTYLFKVSQEMNPLFTERREMNPLRWMLLAMLSLGLLLGGSPLTVRAEITQVAIKIGNMS